MVSLKLEIPEGFYEEEIESDFIITRKRKEVWAVELDLLSELLKVCIKHNLTIFADGGTILGAVRHKGFIPWDDDIDMMMMREDYEKLCRIASSEFSHPYFFQTEFSDPGSLRGHAQLRNSNTTGILKSEYNEKYGFNQGIFIDVFPLDSAPDDYDDLESVQGNTSAYLNMARKRARFTTRYVDKGGGIKRVLKKMIHIILSNNTINSCFDSYYSLYERECKKSNNVYTKRVAKFFDVTENKKKQVWNREWFESVVWTQFEFMTIPLPNGYERILESFFGDWKTPVRLNNTHGGVFFDTSHSYKEYLNKKENIEI